MTVDFGNALAIDAQAFGRPGQRTFRLRVMGAHEEMAYLWLEKQHLQALDLAIMQILAQLDYGGDVPAPPTEFPPYAGHEFRVGRMAIGVDQADGTIVLHAFELGEEEDDQPALKVRLRAPQCAALDIQLKEIIAAGRPICRLCGASIDATGHTCVRANGHSRQPIPEEPPEEQS